MTKNVVFLCTGNSARSQMAEAFLRKHGSDRFDAYSAGLDPKGIHPLTVRAMAEAGIDVSGYRSKGVSDFLGKKSFQYLITVCDRAEKNCPTAWPGIVHRLHWTFEDPAAYEGSEEAKLDKFREVRNQIEKKVLDWLKLPPA